MCGIVGIYGVTNQLKVKGKFINALHSLNHRGGDGEKLWISPDKSVYLGHTLLKINDYVSGEQPLLNHDGSVVVVANGEFYDYKKIRKSLESSIGYVFKTESDSEILLALYESYGVKSLNHLRGEFAFVLWDAKNHLLFGARDRFGIKPLYYTIYENMLFFGSEIKSLIALGIQPVLDSLAITYVELDLWHRRYSCFKNILSLEPGHYFIMKPNQEFTITKYWDINFNSTLYNHDSQFLETSFAQIFKESVAIRMNDYNGRIGCYLSGGIDSGSILSLMTRNSRHPIDAFTISFPNFEPEQLELARRVAKYCGAQHRVLTLSDEKLSKNFESVLWHAESVISNMHTVAKFLLGQFVRSCGIRVIMSGEGADELLLGYKQLVHDASCEDSNYEDLQLVKDVIGFVPKAFSIGLNKAKSFSEFHLNQDTGRRNIQLAFFDFLNELSNVKDIPDNSHKSAYFWIKSILPGYILLQGDRMEMAHSIEGRYPFLDHCFAEFLAKLPLPLKVNNGIEKHILRKVTEKWIPKKNCKAKKQAFWAPLTNLNSTPFLNLMKDVFNDRILKENQFYDQKKVLYQFNRISSMSDFDKIKYNSIFMHILSVCLLEKMFSQFYRNNEYL